MDKFISFARLIVSDPENHPEDLKEMYRASDRAILLSEDEFQETMKRLYSGTK